jgi:hypothetical protein
MPAVAIQQHHGVSALGDSLADLVEMKLHGLGVGKGHGERGAAPRAGQMAPKRQAFS